MERTFISDLQPGCHIDQVFLITQKDLRTTTNGALYIHTVLADRTGQMPARMWQASETIYQTLPENGFVRLVGRTESYKGNLQFIIEAVRPADLDRIDPGDFLPQTSGDIEKMYARVLEIMRTVENRHLLLLVKQFVADEPLMGQFKQAPAAIGLHHARIGGLLEHTLNMLELVLLICPRFPQLNRDLMLVGTFLHDMGKTAELKWETGFAYTEKGQLVGHLVEAATWVKEQARAVEQELNEPFPPRLLWAVQHLILAHHGRYEFGSPKLPMMAEALALHHLDNLDAKLDLIEGEITDEKYKDEPFTRYLTAMEAKLYRADLLPEPEADQEA